MKLHLLFLFLASSLFFNTSKAQTIDIPDINFLNKLLEASPKNSIAQDENGNYIKIDSNGDGKIQVEEAMNVYYLNIEDDNQSTNKINSLSGIGKFKTLVYLYCSYTYITSLNVSELTNLKRLNCLNNNYLDNLIVNNMPNLEFLDCRFNNLTHLNVSNSPKLVGLSCNGNNLQFINLKGTDFKVGMFNDHVIIDPNDNPNLKYICIDDEKVYIVKIFAPKGISINSYCSFNPSGNYYTIQGNSYLNTHNNCEIKEKALSNLKLEIIHPTSKTNYLISDKNGIYKLYINEGNYTITPQLENPDYFTVTPPKLVVDTNSLLSDTLVQNFCITPIGTKNDLEITIIPINVARPGFDADYKITYKNKGNTVLSGIVNLTFPGNLMNFVSANPSYSNKETNSLSWNYSDLKPFESGEITVTLKVSPPPVVNIDENIFLSTHITPSENDETPMDNFIRISQTVVGSFDPNDKTCLEGNTITPEMVGEYVHYLIRFENTGTYYAENVVVKDVIDTTKFDISTLQITDASHSLNTRITDGNIVEFIFEGIKLPITEPERHGYIAFKIKTKPNLVIGDELKNIADIFFDYNLPITTNEAKTIVEKKEMGIENLTTEKSTASIYPNPVKDILYFTSKENIKKIEIFDTNGKLIRVSQINNNYQINVSTLTQGVYYITLYSDKGNKTQSRFIKK